MLSSLISTLNHRAKFDTVSVGCDKLACKTVASRENVTASVGTPEHEPDHRKTRANRIVVCLRIAVIIVRALETALRGSLSHPTVTAWCTNGAHHRPRPLAPGTRG